MADFRTTTLLALVAMATAACASAPVAVDDLFCAELSAFVAASSSFSSNSVVLRGGWGGDAKGDLMTHDCQFFGGISGDRFCEYLVPNTSWEFGKRNLDRLAACLDDREAARALAHAGESTLPTEVSTAIAMPGNESVELVLSYTPANMTSGLYKLSIAVSGDGRH